MKNKQAYIRDIAEVRAMMERSSKFLSLSGLAGVLAGIYALLGVYIAGNILGFDPVAVYPVADSAWGIPSGLLAPIGLGSGILFFAVGTAALLSARKAGKNKEKLWNPVTRRLLIHMLVPLASGGILILLFAARGMADVMIPFTLIFYGLALYNSGRFTYGEISSLGLIQVILGLLAVWQPQYGLTFWALGFGIAHILYGMYMHYRYER